MALGLSTAKHDPPHVALHCGNLACPPHTTPTSRPQSASAKKRAKNKDQRDTLKRDIEPVLDWLAGGKSRNKSNRVLLVRDKEAFEGVADVNDFRAFRECEGQEGTSHTLERLEDFEASFERRFKGESDSNLAALADNMRRSMMDLGMRMIGR